MDEDDRRAAVEAHHAASARGDLEAVHAIYHDDVVVSYPQSGEVIHGLADLKALRAAYPAKLDFTVSRIQGAGELWLSEYIIRYDGAPVHVVGIMKFDGEKVSRETLYFADPFEPPAWRAQWVERFDPREPEASP